METWQEVCRGQIPVGTYQLESLEKQEARVILTLVSDTNRVEMIFRTVLATRVLAKESIPEQLYAEQEMEKFREEQFKNIIYQITDGEFHNFVTRTCRGKARSMCHNQYLIMEKDTVIEILAVQEPEIQNGSRI